MFDISDPHSRKGCSHLHMQDSPTCQTDFWRSHASISLVLETGLLPFFSFFFFLFIEVFAYFSLHLDTQALDEHRTGRQRHERDLPATSLSFHLFPFFDI